MRAWSGNLRIGLLGIAPDMHDKAANGLFLGTEHVLQVSNSQVPIEEATLERSGVASVDSDKLVGAVSYDTQYAVKQHEDLELQHDAGRNAKYLENAFNSERDVVIQIIADEIRK